MSCQLFKTSINYHYHKIVAKTIKFKLTKTWIERGPWFYNTILNWKKWKSIFIKKWILLTKKCMIEKARTSSTWQIKKEQLKIIIHSISSYQYKSLILTKFLIMHKILLIKKKWGEIYKSLRMTWKNKVREEG